MRLSHTNKQIEVEPGCRNLIWRAKSIRWSGLGFGGWGWGGCSYLLTWALINPCEGSTTVNSRQENILLLFWDVVGLWFVFAKVGSLLEPENPSPWVQRVSLG